MSLRQSILPCHTVNGPILHFVSQHYHVTLSTLQLNSICDRHLSLTLSKKSRVEKFGVRMECSTLTNLAQYTASPTVKRQRGNTHSWRNWVMVLFLYTAREEGGRREGRGNHLCRRFLSKTQLLMSSPFQDGAWDRCATCQQIIRYCCHLLMKQLHISSQPQRPTDQVNSGVSMHCSL